MVLLHGMMSTAATWWRAGPALAGRGWVVDALDLPARWVEEVGGFADAVLG